MKHLSTPRKGNDSRSSGERTGNSPNRLNLMACQPLFRRCCRASHPRRHGAAAVRNRVGRRTFLEGTAAEGESPVADTDPAAGGVPEYHAAR